MENRKGELIMEINKIYTSMQLAEISFAIFHSPTCQNSGGCNRCKAKKLCKFLIDMLDYLDEA